MSKPTNIELGQKWSYQGLQGRPLVVIAIKILPGCSPRCPPDQKEPWAVFRKNKKQPCHDMINNPTWVYQGMAPGRFA